MRSAILFTALAMAVCSSGRANEVVKTEREFERRGVLHRETDYSCDLGTAKFICREWTKIDGDPAGIMFLLDRWGNMSGHFLQLAFHQAKAEHVEDVRIYRNKGGGVVAQIRFSLVSTKTAETIGTGIVRTAQLPGEADWLFLRLEGTAATESGQMQPGQPRVFRINGGLQPQRQVKTLHVAWA